MYLKSLSISGFKSFADKTKLDFLPPKDGRFSITGIVGPNGSGKSNVVDAIRWVMGEQSLKTLRGKKSEDIIFGGSAARAALGACEISMILDNADQRADIETEEIVITRRLYRNGEGEYLINNNPVRMLDIHLLLAKAQFGQHSYSIVGQGTIDKMLTVTTAERKDFLDEASGIKEYQIKHHQAGLKLARTSENMLQVETLLKEVEPRLRMLHKQVKKLEQRHEVEINLREAQEKYYGSLYWSNKNEMDRLGKILADLETNYRASFKDLENIQNELSDLARLESRQEVFVKLQEKHQSAVKVKNEWERQLAVLSGKIQNAYSDLGKQNIGWLEKKVSELQGVKEKLNREQVALEEQIYKAEKFYSEKSAIAEETARDKTQAAVRLSQLQTKQFEQKSERQYLEFSGLTAVRSVLENKNRFGKVYGLFSELGEVDSEYSTAMEVAAGANMSSLVVADEGVAKAAIEFLREERMGVATFLPINKITPRNTSDVSDLLHQDGVCGLAIDLIKFDEKFRNVFSFVLGDTLIVKNLAVAQRLGIGRIRYVTLDGDVAEKRGVMKGGWRGQKKMHLSFSGRNIFSDTAGLNYQEELIKQEQSFKDLEMKLDQVRTAELLAKMDKEKLDLQLQTLLSQITDQAKELSELERELNFLQMSPDEYGAHLQTLEGEKNNLKTEIEKSEREIAGVAAEIKLFNDSEEEKKQRVFALQESMQKKQMQVNEILNQRNDFKIQLAKIETKNEDLNNEATQELSSSLVSIAERWNTVLSQAELDEVAASISKFKYQLSLIGGIDEEVVKEYETTKERFDFLTNQLNDLTKAVGDLTTMIEELDEIMKKKRASAFRQIRKEFDRYFQILFNGGSAQLEEIYGESESEESLDANGNVVGGENSENILAENTSVKKRDKILTGIDVIVNPPGKKIKNINSLSGGERTLTSIALICAILNCNPSPFVVMDEVEAALDESNTMRFANIMGELATKSQFIVITHNRVTMHSADALYGVTMGGEGVSKLLSVNIGEVGKYADKENVDKTS